MQKLNADKMFRKPSPSVDDWKGLEYAPYEDLVELNEAGLLILENDIIVYGNPSFFRVMERPQEEVIGQSIFHFTAEEDLAELQRQFAELLSGEISLLTNNFRVKLDGDKVKFFSLHAKVKSEKGGVYTLYAASGNSTARVLAKRELVRTKSKFEAMYRNMLDGIFIYNYVTEKTEDCNDAAVRVLNYDTKEEVLEKNRFDYIPQFSHHFPGSDLHEITRMHGVMVVEGKSFFTRGVFNIKGGGQILANVNVVPTFDKVGEAYVIFHDTTDTVTQRRALKASEKRYRDIFENSHEAISLFDVETGKIIDCNENALQLYGVKSKAQLENLPRGNFHENFFKNHKDAKKYIKSKIKEAKEKGRAFATFEAVKLTGEEFVYEGVFVLNKNEKSKLEMLTFARDIQDRLNAEKEKNKLIGELVEAKKEIDQQNKELQKYIESNLQLENFAYFASHDLRTPLRSIISFTQLLKKSMQDKMGKIDEEYMQFIVDAGVNMQRLIEDLLSFSRINTEALKFEKITTIDLLLEIEKELSVLRESKSATICYCNMPSLIFADRTKIKQLFQNLITNGLKFIEKGKQPQLKISGEETERYWQFSISDNGIGIDEEYKDKIFLMFKRLHNSTEYEGTGIGLAMCKKIIEQHDGQIWFESEVSKGTTFYFTIRKYMDDEI